MFCHSANPQPCRWTRTRSGVNCPPTWTSVRRAAPLAHSRSSTSSICLPMSVRWRGEKSRRQTAAAAAAAWLQGTTGSRSRFSLPHLVRLANGSVHQVFPHLHSPICQQPNNRCCWSHYRCKELSQKISNHGNVTYSINTGKTLQLYQKAAAPTSQRTEGWQRY